MLSSLGRRTNTFLHGPPPQQQRVFFYQVDLRGRLFLEGPHLTRRNDATCLKSPQFLDFFFSRLQKCSENRNARWSALMKEFERDYAWFSPCGRELNFVRADDTPIVYKALSVDNDDGQEYLHYAGTLRCEFDPGKLVVACGGERIYYRGDKFFGLLHPDLAQRLCGSMRELEGSGRWELEWKGKRYTF